MNFELTNISFINWNGIFFPLNRLHIFCVENSSWHTDKGFDKFHLPFIFQKVCVRKWHWNEALLCADYSIHWREPIFSLCCHYYSWDCDLTSSSNFHNCSTNIERCAMSATYCGRFLLRWVSCFPQKHSKISLVDLTIVIALLSNMILHRNLHSRVEHPQLA